MKVEEGVQICKDAWWELQRYYGEYRRGEACPLLGRLKALHDALRPVTITKEPGKSPGQGPNQGD